MNFYLDSSCLVRAIVRDGPVLAAWARWERVYSSRLAFVEVSRTIYRFRLERSLSPEAIDALDANFQAIWSGIFRFPVDDDVLAMASEPLPMHLKTLDALHLATARIVRNELEPELTFATHDRRLAAAAQAFGFPVAGV